MAFVDQVGVAEIRVRVGDARPGGAAMPLRLGYGPQRVAMAHGVLRGGSRPSDQRRHHDFCTYFKHIRIAKIWIQREQFLPAVTVSEASSCKLPKRVAGLDGDDG